MLDFPFLLLTVGDAGDPPAAEVIRQADDDVTGVHVEVPL